MSNPNMEKLRQEEYRRRLAADLRRREVYTQNDPNSDPDLIEQLMVAEKALGEIEAEISSAMAKDKNAGLILDNTLSSELLGPETTGLEVSIYNRMNSIVTSIYHLFDPEQTPLVSFKIRNVDDQKARRIRATSYLEGYSARAVDTLELRPRQEFTIHQLPVLYPAQVHDLTELTRASLTVMVEDLDGSVELQRSRPIWMLSRNSAPLAVRDPQTGMWRDLSMYFGAFVTPNVESIMRFLRLTAEHHPQRQLVGYQGDPEDIALQVRAAFDALKTESRVIYVNSILEFNPDQGFATQRVRLPRQSLTERQANCIDGTVLFASLLEAMSLSPAIVVVPGHAFLGWETWTNSNEWRYLETTMIGSYSFEEAIASAEETSRRYQDLAQSTGQQHYFIRHAIRELRAIMGITPLE